MSAVEKSIFKLQHTINYLNCGNEQAQITYLKAKLLIN
jgi:hypothetical protein